MLYGYKICIAVSFLNRQTHCSGKFCKHMLPFLFTLKEEMRDQKLFPFDIWFAYQVIII